MKNLVRLVLFFSALSFLLVGCSSIALNSAKKSYTNKKYFDSIKFLSKSDIKNPEAMFYTALLIEKKFGAYDDLSANSYLHKSIYYYRRSINAIDESGSAKYNLLRKQALDGKNRCMLKLLKKIAVVEEIVQPSIVLPPGSCGWLSGDVSTGLVYIDKTFEGKYARNSSKGYDTYLIGFATPFKKRHGVYKSTYQISTFSPKSVSFKINNEICSGKFENILQVVDGNIADKGFVTDQKLLLNRYKVFANRYNDYSKISDVKALVDEIYFNIAKSGNTVASYKLYLRENPKGNFVSEAKLYIQEIEFYKADQQYNTEGYRNYLSRYPQSYLVQEALSRIAEIEQYDIALSYNELSVYLKYVEEFPNSKKINDVLNRIIDFELDEISLQRGDIDTYVRFIEKQQSNQTMLKAKSSVAKILGRNVVIKNIHTEYNSKGVYISGVLQNNNPFNVDGKVLITFTTKSLLDGNKIYMGRSYVEALPISMTEGDSKDFKIFVNTLVNCTYRGIVLDLLDTANRMTQRLKVGELPRLFVITKEFGSPPLDEEGVERSYALIEKAQHVRNARPRNFIDGILGRNQGVGGTTVTTTSDMFAKIKILEKAVKLAPLYYEARYQLANEYYGYAGKMTTPTNMLRYYLESLFNAINACQISNEKNAYELAKKGNTKCKRYASSAKMYGAFMKKTSEKVYELYRETDFSDYNRLDLEPSIGTSGNENSLDESNKKVTGVANVKLLLRSNSKQKTWRVKCNNGDIVRINYYYDTKKYYNRTNAGWTSRSFPTFEEAAKVRCSEKALLP